MYKIRCFTDFTPSDTIQKEIERKCLNFINPSSTSHYGINKKFIFTILEDYTHVIIINKAMPPISHIPKKNVIGFAYEPLQFLHLTDVFIEYAQKYIHQYFLGDKVDLPEPFTEGNGFMICYIPTPLNLKPKDKFMSIMISPKIMAPGHKYRHQLVDTILKTNLPIDIYGKGCIYYSMISDNRIKGEFEESELYDGYRFTIAIENFQSNHYFSEKIINPLLQKITPLYLGCYTIDTYFPETCIHLSGDLQQDMQLIENIYKTPEKYSISTDLKKIDATTNLIANLPTLFSASTTN